MKSQPLLRLDKTPATQRPPSADCVDLIFDAEAGVLKAIDAEGEVPFSGATGGGEVTPASLVTAAQAMTPTQEAGMRTNIGPFVDVTSAPYNAVGDAKFRHDAAISSGSSTLTSATAGFVADDVGKYIRIVGAGTTATATLAVSGGAITGGTVTNPGSVGAYPANTTFPLLITGPGLNAAVTATTNANGQVASIAVPAGGTGYTSAGCTFPPADLIATIATRVSASQVTLSRSAAATVSGKDVYWGTDSTAAIQAAIEAAKIDKMRVYIPRGNYLCNLLGYSDMQIEGDSSGNALSNMPSYISLPTSGSSTVLFPAHTALPVIRYDYGHGSSVRRLTIIGSYGKTGIGVEIGTPAILGVYHAQNFVVDSVSVFGFDKCFAVKSTNMLALAMNFGWANTGFWVGHQSYGGGGVGLCAYAPAGYHCTRFFDGNLSNGLHVGVLVIDNADFNFGTTVARNCNLQWRRVNFEDITGNAVEIGSNAGFAHLRNVTHLRLTGDLVRNAGGAGARVSIDCESGTYSTAFADYPQMLSPAITIARYSSTAFTTLMETERASVVYMPTALTEKYRRIEEAWAGVLTGGAGTNIGQLAWTTANITNTFLARPFVGGCEWYSGSNAAGTAARFALQNNICFASSDFYEIRSIIRVWDGAATPSYKFRFGLYERETTADMDPTYGIGIFVDTAVDNFVKLEIRNGGTSTLVPTTCTAADLNTFREIKISRRAGGVVSLVISNLNGSAAFPQVSSSATSPSGAVTLAAFSQILTGGSWHSVYFGKTTMQFLPSN